MKRTTFFITTAFLLLTAFATLKVSATIWVVDVKNYEFSPEDLDNVQVNDTIRWVWVEGSHTTTSSDIPAGAESWDEPMTSSATVFDYVPTVAGTYNYVCTPHASFGMVGSFVVSTISGIAGNNRTPEISIAPNPFTDKVTINMVEENAMAFDRLKVYGLTGELVFDAVMNDGSGSRSLHLGDLLNGLYFFEFSDASGNVYVERVIKK